VEVSGQALTQLLVEAAKEDAARNHHPELCALSAPPDCHPDTEQIIKILTEF